MGENALASFRVYLNLDGGGKPAAGAERLRGDLQDGRGLLAFVLGALHQPDYLLDEAEVESVCGRNALRGFVALDVGFENGIENLVGRRRVGVFLARPQLGGRRLFEDRWRNDFAVAIEPV